MNWALLNNFSEWEFACKCGCGRADMDPYFLFMLQAIRNIYGSSISISSGYRCPSYNKIKSTTGLNGPHTTGCAIDIPVHGHYAHKLVRVALNGSALKNELDRVIAGAKANSIASIHPKPLLVGGIPCMAIVSGYGSKQTGTYGGRFVHFDNLPHLQEDLHGARRSPRPWHWTYP